MLNNTTFKKGDYYMLNNSTCNVTYENKLHFYCSGKRQKTGFRSRSPGSINAAKKHNVE